MSGKVYEELNILNRKLDDLLNRYDYLKNELSDCKKNNEDLKHIIEEKELKIKNLEVNYEKVKLSGALAGETENAAEAKSKITELVREIDKCVALLNR